MDTNCNGLCDWCACGHGVMCAGGVDWDEFCTYMMHDLEEKTNRRNERDLPLLVRWKCIAIHA